MQQKNHYGCNSSTWALKNAHPGERIEPYMSKLVSHLNYYAKAIKYHHIRSQSQFKYCIYNCYYQEYCGEGHSRRDLTYSINEPSTYW